MSVWCVWAYMGLGNTDTQFVFTLYLCFICVCGLKLGILVYVARTLTH